MKELMGRQVSIVSIISLTRADAFVIVSKLNKLDAQGLFQRGTTKTTHGLSSD